MLNRSLLPLVVLAGFGCATAPDTLHQVSAAETSGVPRAAWASIPRLEEVLESKFDAANVPGAQVAIIKDGEVVWAAAFGVRDAELGDAVTDDTSFMLASVSKTVTGVALLQAYESGAFDLDDPIAPYLDFVVDHPGSDTEITFRHLLTHTSGIRDDWDVLDGGYAVGDPAEPLGAFLERVLDPAGADYSRSHFYRWGPGEGYEYSNVGAALAGHLVEATTGVDLRDWSAEHIFEPLAMDHTSWTLDGLDDALLAHPHLCGARCTPLPHYGYPDYPDGLLRSSAEDMGRFLAAVSNGGEAYGRRLLSEETVNEMLAVHVPDEGQGLIWYHDELRGTELIGHNGGDMGVSTEMFMRADDHTGFVVLMNGDPSRWSHVQDVESILLRAADRLF
ncbi:MAG: CubicO group peptidase (beta-lactamase class C family) [Myxococcota bacterium]|jgi:CubicO group peptidase (beta-lactamase class C family)